MKIPPRHPRKGWFGANRGLIGQRRGAWVRTGRIGCPVGAASPPEPPERRVRLERRGPPPEGPEATSASIFLKLALFSAPPAQRDRPKLQRRHCTLVQNGSNEKIPSSTKPIDEGAPSLGIRANLKRAAGEIETAGTATFKSNRTDCGNVAGGMGK